MVEALHTRLRFCESVALDPTSATLQNCPFVGPDAAEDAAAVVFVVAFGAFVVAGGFVVSFGAFVVAGALVVAGGFVVSFGALVVAGAFVVVDALAA